MTWFRCSKDANLGTKNITENGTYNAVSDNLDGYSQVNVNVPNPSSGSINITQNGTYDVTDKASAIVQVSGSGDVVVSGTFTLESDKYLYYNIQDTPDSVYEIPHGLGITPNFFVFWCDGSHGAQGNTIYVFGAMLPTNIAMYQVVTNAIIGTTRSSGEASINSYGADGGNIIADATNVTLRGSNSTTSRFLRANRLYHWIAGYISTEDQAENA